MVKNKALPDSAAHPQSGLSLSLSLFPLLTPFILRVPLDPAGAGPRHPLSFWTMRLLGEISMEGIDGWQNMPSPNMSLWYEDDFAFSALEK